MYTVSSVYFKAIGSRIQMQGTSRTAPTPRELQRHTLYEIIFLVVVPLDLLLFLVLANNQQRTQTDTRADV